MSIPKHNELYNLFLESLSDDQVHSIQECRDYIKQRVNFTKSDLSETTSSGIPKWHDRIGWCKTYLKKAGLIESPKRGHFKITNSGKKILKDKVKITDKLLIEKFPAFREFIFGKDFPKNNEISLTVETETPQELFERSYQEITSELSDEILTAILNMSSDFFERLVVKLMEAMGYGGYEGAGFVTKSSGDGGIDGVIYEDKLGFNLIYIQAKRWSPDKTIQKPEVQKFVGALAGPPKIEKGLFITTAKFSDGAQKYANDQHVILVDGKKLTELMIEFDVGVSTQKIYKIKRVDNDFFSEE